jgi:hypothetical protein
MSHAELFYRGTIVRYSKATRRGLLRSMTGREIQFDLQFVTLGATFRGNHPEIEVREGIDVGFDVGWTSRGLRASRIFAAPAPSEREAGQEGDITTDEGTGQNEYQLDIE